MGRRKGVVGGLTEILKRRRQLHRAVIRRGEEVHKGGGNTSNVDGGAQVEKRRVLKRKDGV